MHPPLPTRVTRMGDFWKFLMTDCFSKVAQIPDDFTSSFEKQHFSSREMEYIERTSFVEIYGLKLA